ncbi:Panacea domain-containing protein [Salimicrobium jeotgali]|uniref:Panacea domain-containing protein n=1 Tax=Salimicrobium jeotgali TaxID=1230341 RepID=UPI000C81D7DC|nr:type II toxin-antitoxin system antitoxin SocA domain-containing protein [Salimicrobium jeotgali]
MAKAIDVAKFLLYLASKDPQVNDLSNLKLQKLLYYSQGVYSVMSSGNKLFEEEIEAWKFGPVVRDVYQTFNSHGFFPIKESEKFINNYNLSSIEKKAIILTWKKFSKYPPNKLVEMTHKYGPWSASWYSRKPFKLIGFEAIYNYFATGGRT